MSQKHNRSSSDISQYPANKITILSTGSQGEL